MVEPARTVLGRIQIPLTPRKAAAWGALAGATVAAAYGVLAAADARQTLEFTLTFGHNIAAFALAAALCALPLPDGRAALAGYAGWSAAYCLLLPTLLDASHPFTLPQALLAGLILLQLAAIWGLVAALLFLFKTWLLRWAERRLGAQPPP